MEFVEAFPTSTHAREAHVRIRELDRLIASADSSCGISAPEDEVVWNTLMGSTRSARVAEIFKACKTCGQQLQLYAFEEFTKKYPSSGYAAEAADTIQSLRSILRVRVPTPKKVNAKSPQSQSRQKTFQLLQGVDFMGGDIGTPPNLRNVSHDECRAACIKEGACNYYAYSLWKRACYLKDQEPQQRVDAEYLSGSANGLDPPPKSEGIVRMRTLNKKTFNPEGDDFTKASSLNECSALCLNQPSCQAVEFLPAKGACYLFEDGADLGAGSGAVAAKYQEQ